MAWYDANFAYKKSIVIPHGKVSGGSDLLDFPVLISLTDSSLKSQSNGGLVCSVSGYDLLFTDGTETRELAYEVESYTASSGALLTWVRVPVLSAAQDTVLYLYFGNSTVTSSLASASKVWDSNYVGVWHLNGSSADSTSNANNGTDTSISYGSSYGQIGQGADTTASPSGIALPTSTLGALGTGDFTIECWIKPNAPAGGSSPSLFQSTSSTGPHYYGPSILFDPNNIQGQGNALVVSVDYANLHAITSPSASSLESTWTHIVYTRASGTNTVYYNGVSQLTFTDSSSLTTPGEVQILSRADQASQSFSSGANGDEYRVSKVARTANWIATEYTNQSTPSSFIVVGQTIPNMLNVDLPALSVGSVSTSPSSGSDQLNVQARGASFVVNTTSVTNSLTLTVQGKDVTSGQYYTVASFPGLGNGVSTLLLYPGVQATAMPASAQSASGVLPRTWRVQIVAASGTAGTTTVGASLIS